MDEGMEETTPQETTVTAPLSLVGNVSEGDTVRLTVQSIDEENQTAILSAHKPMRHRMGGIERMAAEYRG